MTAKKTDDPGPERMARVLPAKALVTAHMEIMHAEHPFK